MPGVRGVPEAVPTIEDLRSVAGLDALGVTTAEPFAEARRALEERKAAGVHGGMAFTYRNPERSTTPTRILPGAEAIVVGALRYRRADASLPSAAGVVARYAREDHYATLRTRLQAVADVLRDRGWKAVVVADDNALVDRAAAVRAGIGWYGKSTNVLIEGAGSWFVLGAVVTDAPLDTSGVREVADGCGACTRCIDACPTGAIVASGVVDARRCLAWLVQQAGTFPLEHRAALGGRLYGCDDCQEVCPPNRLDDRRHPPPAGADGAVDLVALLDASDADIIERHGRWYIPERDPRWVRRNALVALGNVGGDDAEVTRVLTRYAAGDDEVLAEHASWALARR